MRFDAEFNNECSPGYELGSCKSSLQPSARQPGEQLNSKSGGQFNLVAMSARTVRQRRYFMWAYADTGSG